MKIIQLNIENFKRLTAVEITPDGSLIQITGKNAQGKTSVLDALWVALEGLRGAPIKPIRKGEESARITVRLSGDPSEMIVTRRFSEKGSSLTVESTDGAIYRKPQAVLDALIGELSFDPLAFVSMRPDAQAAELIRLADTDMDLEESDRLDAEDFAARTDENREARRFAESAEQILLPENIPDTPVDAAALSESIEAAIAHNSEIDAAASRLAGMRTDKGNLVATIQGLKDQIAAAEKRETEITSKIHEAEEAAKKAERIDTEPLRLQMRAAAATNAAIEDAKRKAGYVAQAATHEANAKNLTEAMEQRKVLRRMAISKAKLPIDGLGLEDGVVTFGGVPFSQASSAEQIKVSMALAMAANPKLRVIRVNEGSLLDSEGLKLIAGMAETEDYQVWMERVDETGKVGVVIEDGHVKGAAKPEPAKKAPEKKADKPSDTSSDAVPGNLL